MSALENLLAALKDGSKRDALRAVPSIEEILQRWLAESQEAWPDVALESGAFVLALAVRLDDVAEDAMAAWCEQLHASDLYLAQACAQGDAKAIEALDARYGNDLKNNARRFAGARFSVDDLLQILREKLFVESAAGRAPKIGGYSGQGPLGSWLSVTALRTFLDCSRSGAQQKREDLFDGEKLEAIMAPDDDLEISFLKRKYRAEFKASFAAALKSLSSGERNLLRHQWVDGLSIDQIGIIYHIHRATAARRIARARETLMRATRAELTKRLGIEHDEVDSIMGLIKSRLDVSVHRLLGEATEAPKLPDKGG